MNAVGFPPEQMVWLFVITLDEMLFTNTVSTAEVEVQTIPFNVLVTINLKKVVTVCPPGGSYVALVAPIILVNPATALVVDDCH